MCGQLRRVVGIPDAVHVGGFTVEDGIAVVDLGDTPSIVHAEERRSAAAHENQSWHLHQADLV